MTTIVPENQQRFGSILTVLGEAAEQNGKLQKKQIEFTHIAIGDANDAYVQPSRTQTKLINEIDRIELTSIDIEQPKNSAPLLIVSATVPEDLNEIVIREFAVVAKFNNEEYLHAVGNCARIYIPSPIQTGNVSTPVTIEMIFSVTSVEPIVRIDPDIISASRDWTGKKILSSENKLLDYAREENNKLQDVFLNKININRGGNSWGTKSINILGDSISHGANVEDIANDSWVGILRKMLNLQFGATNHGFVSIADKMINSIGTFQDIHKVSKTGNWTVKSGLDASHVMNGYLLSSNNAGDSIEITVPTITDKFAIWYDRAVIGGDFKLYINGSQTHTLSTQSPNESGEGGFYWFTNFDLKDNGTGVCKIKIEVVGNGTVSIVGLSYLDNKDEFQVNNFSQSGRKIRDLSRDVITRACKGASTLILALGHNDQYLTGSDKQSTLDNVDYLVEQCLASNIKLYIVDFCWHKDYTNYVREKLKEISNKIPRCTYLNFAEYFKVDGETVSPSTTINELKFLSDGSHPSKFGHQVIAETLANSMGLAFNSKKQAEMFYQAWEPVNNFLNEDFKNTFDKARYITACRRNGNALHVRIYLSYSDDNSVPIPAGTYELFRLPEKYFVPYTATELLAGSAKAYKDALKLAYITYYSGQNSKVEVDVPEGFTSSKIVAQLSIPINCDFEFDMY